MKRKLVVGDELFYYKTRTGKEIDFLVKGKGGIQLIQVSYDLTDGSTFQREKRALIEAAKEVGIDRGMIINGNLKERVEEDEVAISILPVWEFLLRE